MVKIFLKDGVYWVGVVDWNIRDFHGYITNRGSHLQRIPNSRRENSVGDTVKHPFAENLFSKSPS